MGEIYFVILATATWVALEFEFNSIYDIKKEVISYDLSIYEILMFEDWLNELEKIFAVMRCQYEDRVLLATYVQGRAYDWWQSTHRVYF